MPKICCINNCRTKSADDESKERKLFSIPQNAPRRQAWLKAMSSHLKEGKKDLKYYRVCDLHFEENDILRNYYILLKDGTTDIIPRFAVTLKPSAVPSIFDGSKKIRTKVDSFVSEEKICSQDPVADEEKSVKKAACEVVDLEAEPTPPKGAKETGFVRHVEKKPEYNLQMLDNDLKSKWKDQNIHSWGATMIYSGLILSYYGDYRNVGAKTILVNEDMTVQIRFSGKNYMRHLKKKITRLNDVLLIMGQVEKNNRCVGVDDASPCPNDYFESSSRSLSTRCFECRIKRRQQINNSAKVEKRAILKRIRTRQLIKNLKGKNERLHKTIETMRETIEELKDHCDSASSEFLIDNEFSSLVAKNLNALKVRLDRFTKCSEDA